MNCQKIEKLMLLEQSGELAGDEQRAIEEHVATCSSCQRYREELPVLLNLATSSQVSDGPAPSVIEAIEREAARRASRVIAFPRPALQLLAYAAAAAFLVGGWMLLNRNAGSVDDGVRIVREDHQPSGDPAVAMGTAADLSALVAMLTDDTESESLEAIETAQDRERVIEVLANQLLRLQGIEPDDELLGDPLLPPDLSVLPRPSDSAQLTG